MASLFKPQVARFVISKMFHIYVKFSKYISTPTNVILILNPLILYNNTR